MSASNDNDDDAPTPAVWKHIGLHGHSVGSFMADTKGIQWKSGFGSEDDASTSRFIATKHLKGAKWTVFGRNKGHLRLDTSKFGELRFDGFPSNNYDVLKETLKKFYNLDVQKHAMSASGTSFGNCRVQGRNLVFSRCILEDADEEGQEFETRDGEELMSLDLAQVSQCVLPGNNRNEIELQFPESDAVEAGTDQLVAIRFYVPPDIDADPQDRSAPSAAELFQSKITKTANIKNKASGNVLCEFDESRGTFLTPRGRYSIELYHTFLRMRGNKYDYKIKYDDISRLFLLPKPDEVHMAFVIALDKPIRQGQQRYQYLVLQTTKEQAQVTVNLDEETLKKEYNGDLQPVMTGSLSNLVAKTFKVITKKKVFIPGKFANANQQACVKCALRANEGHLYPLEKQFIFIHKPPVLVRFDEVESVEFQRYAGGTGSTRNFDLNVALKDTTGPAKEYTFSGIDRSDYAGLYNFLSGKRIRIKNLQSQESLLEAPVASAPIYNEILEGEEEEESEDEDYDDNAVVEAGSSSGSEMDSEADEDLDSDVVDDDEDSDLEEARQKAGVEKKKKKRKSDASDSVASIPKKKAKAEEKPSSPAKKSKKKKKDPNAPKRAMTAFMLFSNAKRAEIKEANPDASFGDLARLVGAEFKALSEEQKEEWTKKAEEEKKRYKEEMANYSAPEDSDDSDDDDDDNDTKASSTKKAKKDPNAPKKARTAYTYFMAQEREKIKEKNPDASFGDLARLVAAEYKKLDKDEKKKWQDMANKDKQRYKDEMEDYEPPEGKSVSSKPAAKKTKAKKDPNAPKRGLTSFMYFSNAVRSKVKEENPDMTFGELGKKIGELFRALSPEEKAKYEAKAKADKQRYKDEMAEYSKKQAKEAAAAAADSDDDDDDSDDSSDDSSDDDDDDSDDDSD